MDRSQFEVFPVIVPAGQSLTRRIDGGVLQEPFVSGVISTRSGIWN